MNRRTAVLAASVFTLSAAGLAHAQPATTRQTAQPTKAPDPANTPAADLPSGWDVLEHEIESMGGVDRYMKLKNLTATGTMEVANLIGKYTRIEAAPDKTYMHIDLGPIGEIVQATDGETAWAVDPMQDPRVLEGEDAEALIARSQFYDRVHPHDRYESAEVVGIENVNRTPCYRVNLVDKAGQSSVGFYEIETGHQVKLMSHSLPSISEFDVVVVMSDFRTDEDGLVHAYKIEQNRRDSSFTIVFDSFEHDTEIDDSVFTMPSKNADG